jgi:hypothetical protein
MLNYSISSPWYTFQRKVAALFGGDPDYKVGDVRECDGSGADYEFDIEVRKHEKFVALERLMPGVKTFGNVRLRINLYDEENRVDDRSDLIRKIFGDNAAVEDIEELYDAADARHTYVLFKPEVVQFFNDDLSDLNGNWSGLAQDIAKEIFEDLPGIHFCTAEKDAEE